MLSCITFPTPILLPITPRLLPGSVELLWTSFVWGVYGTHSMKEVTAEKWSEADREQIWKVLADATQVRPSSRSVARAESARA